MDFSNILPLLLLSGSGGGFLTTLIMLSMLGGTDLGIFSGPIDLITGGDTTENEVGGELVYEDRTITYDSSAQESYQTLQVDVDQNIRIKGYVWGYDEWDKWISFFHPVAYHAGLLQTLQNNVVLDSQRKEGDGRNYFDHTIAVEAGIVQFLQRSGYRDKCGAHWTVTYKELIN